jgi:DNA topoisomerase IB
MPRLRRVDCSGPGIRRVRRGRGFQYLEEDGTPVGDAEVKERIASLAIPPAWKDVWICPLANGHLQATGLDAAGRKQYLYHEAWRESRDREKFDEMLRFARALPRMRNQVGSDLALRGLRRDRVLACAVRLLDLGFFRVGSDQYAAENETFGLSTLRKRHLRFEGTAAVFDYKAKGSQRQVQEIEDVGAVKVLRALARRKAPGYRLFAYRERSEWQDLSAEEINVYLKSIAGESFSAKDFRTWNATVLAAVGLANRVEPGEKISKSARKRIVNEVVKDVATYLSNTPAVCRASYIDPRVFDFFDSRATIRRAVQSAISEPRPDRFPDRERIEQAVLKLLS